jgi:hypothetical protein
MNPYCDIDKKNITKDDIEYNEYDFIAKIEYLRH